MSRQPSRLVALWCWYHGGGFRGYQAQAEGPTVQATVIDALRKAGLSRNPVASGRTDAGVHARMQVLSLRVIEPIPTSELAARITSHLPSDVGIALAKDAPAHFNAHWRAESKKYRYRLRLDERAVTTSERQSLGAWTWSLPSLDVATLRATLGHAVGTHDFFAFHDRSGVVRQRTIHSVEIVEGDQGLVEVRLRGEGFGRYMVRYLIGGAVAVASGVWTQRGFADALASGETKERPKELSRAPAHGLVLWSVDYPAADDPFTAEERRAAANVPATPPFISPSDDLRTSRAGR